MVFYLAFKVVLVKSWRQLTYSRIPWVSLVQSWGSEDPVRLEPVICESCALTLTHEGPLRYDSNASSQFCLFVWGFTLYQQYFSHLMATGQKSMFPGLFFSNQYFNHWRASRSAIPIILSAKGKSHYYQF